MTDGNRSSHLACDNGVGLSLLDLPEEIFLEIAEQLAAAFALRSLASFNAVCYCIHEATLPVLYRTVIRSAGDSATLNEGEESLCSNSIPKSWRYTKYLFMDEATLERFKKVNVRHRAEMVDPINALFPSLVFLSCRTPRPSRVESWGSTYAKKDRRPLIIDNSIRIYKPISPSSLLLASVIGTQSRQTSIADGIFQRPIVLPTNGISMDIVMEQRQSCFASDLADLVVTDNIRSLRFNNPDAYFLEDSHSTKIEPACGVLEIDTDNLDGDCAPDSRSKRIATCLMNLISPRAVSGAHPDTLLPKIKLIGNVAFAFALIEELLTHLPLKANLQIIDKSSTSIYDKRHQVSAIAEQYHRCWDEIGLPSSVGCDARFFHLSCPTAGTATGYSMFTAILVRSPNTASDSQRGFYHIQRAPDYNGGLYKVLFHQTVPHHAIKVISVLESGR